MTAAGRARRQERAWARLREQREDPGVSPARRIAAQTMRMPRRPAPQPWNATGRFSSWSFLLGELSGQRKRKNIRNAKRAIQLGRGDERTIDNTSRALMRYWR